MSWYNLRSPSVKEQTSVNSYVVDFPGYFSLEELLENSTQIHYALYDGESIARFLGYSSSFYDPEHDGFERYFDYSKSIPKRLLTSNEHFNYSLTQNLETRIVREASTINLSPYYNLGSQYLILYGLSGQINLGKISIRKNAASAIVIQHICCSEAEVIWDSEYVKHYIQHFNSQWISAKPLSTPTYIPTSICILALSPLVRN